MTTDMTTAIVVLARRRLALLEVIESNQQALADIDAQLIDAIEVGGKVEIDGQPVLKISERKGTFDPAKAREIVPGELLEAATVPTLDAKALQKMMPPALVDACRKPSSIFVSKA